MPVETNKVEASIEKSVSADSWKCSNCGHINTGKFCSECGKEKVVYKNNFCSKCGSKLEESNKFCPNCGNKI